MNDFKIDNKLTPSQFYNLMSPRLPENNKKIGDVIAYPFVALKVFFARLCHFLFKSGHTYENNNSLFIHLLHHCSNAHSKEVLGQINEVWNRFQNRCSESNRTILNNIIRAQEQCFSPPQVPDPKPTPVVPIERPKELPKEPIEKPKEPERDVKVDEDEQLLMALLQESEKSNKIEEIRRKLIEISKKVGSGKRDNEDYQTILKLIEECKQLKIDSKDIIDTLERLKNMLKPTTHGLFVYLHPVDNEFRENSSLEKLIVELNKEPNDEKIALVVEKLKAGKNLEHIEEVVREIKNSNIAAIVRVRLALVREGDIVSHESQGAKGPSVTQACAVIVAETIIQLHKKAGFLDSSDEFSSIISSGIERYKRYWGEAHDKKYFSDVAKKINGDLIQTDVDLLPYIPDNLEKLFKEIMDESIFQAIDLHKNPFEAPALDVKQYLDKFLNIFAEASKTEKMIYVVFVCKDETILMVGKNNRYMLVDSHAKRYYRGERVKVEGLNMGAKGIPFTNIKEMREYLLVYFQNYKHGFSGTFIKVENKPKIEPPNLQLLQEAPTQD